MNTKRLVELRTQLNRTQKEVAEEIGCSQEMISQIELGKKDLKAQYVKRLAEYYGVPMEELI